MPISYWGIGIGRCWQVLVLVLVGIVIGRYWWVLLLVGIGIGIGIGISKTLRKRYFDKVLIFHKVRSKLFRIVVSESINGFSKF